jgi:hypothetical protein
MKCSILVLLACVTAALIGGSLQAGAKGGKVRWSSNPGKTKAKKLPPLKIPPQKWIELKITFEANKLAEFFVIGDGDSDLDVYVYDEKGKQVASDVDAPEYGSDLCVCRWTPTVEQEYKIKIVNLGKVPNTAQAGCN